MKTSSYWIDSAELPAFPALERDLDVDVLVVGGGLMGLTAAYLATRAGNSVAVVERARCASIDTGHTTAHLTPVVDTRFHQLAKDFGRDAARAVWDAGSAAIDQIVRCIRAEDIECDFRWVPGYLHAPVREVDRRYLEELEAEAEELARLEIPGTLLPQVPLFQTPGIKFPHQALFHPRKYLLGLAKAAIRGGCQIFETTSADEFTDQPLGAKAGGRQIRCRYLILATHTPLSGNTGILSATAFQSKLALYSSYVVAGKLPLDGAPVGSFWDNSEPYDYLRVEKHQDHAYAIFGGEDHKTGQEEDTVAVYSRLEKRLKEILPDVRVDHRWSGQVIETNDGLPFIGETADKQFAATGFAGNGMTFGTLSAMMAIDKLMGRKNPWEDLFDIHRKKIRGGTWTYLKENKDYPYYLIRDWIAPAEADSVEAVLPGEGKIVKFEGRKVAAYRSKSGKLSLCSPVCTHLKCIVDWNTAEQTWDCPCHGSRFTPEGEVISGPAEEPLEKIKP